MDCNRFRLMLSRELDGELDARGQDELQRHLGECPECRGYRLVLLETAACHRELPEAGPPPAILAAVMAEIEGRNRDAAAWWYRIAVPAAAVLIMLLGLGAGVSLNEAMLAENGNGVEEVLGLEQLDDYPPGSFGEILVAATEGGDDG